MTHHTFSSWWLHEGQHLPPFDAMTYEERERYKGFALLMWEEREEAEDKAYDEGYKRAIERLSVHDTDI